MSKRKPPANAKTAPSLALERLLFSQGFGSRHECRGLCLQGRVATGEQTITNPEAPIDVAEGLIFQVDGKAWPYHAKAYIALHKPVGYECSHKPSHHPSIYTLLSSPLRIRDVQAAGRLDADTTGLLLFSDDGQFIHKAISGKKHLPKTYLITAKHPITQAMCGQLLGGVRLDGEREPVAAASCELQDDHHLLLTITTGKYHQVKRMVAAVGNRVEALHRISVGAMVLPDALQPGQWTWITPEDVFA